MILVGYMGCCFSCRDNSAKPFTLIKIFPDTLNSWQAKREFGGYTARRKLSEKLGLPDIEKCTDSIEIRVWWQASIYTPSSVWVIHHSPDSSSAFRIDYYRDYSEELAIDSVQIFKQTPNAVSWAKYLEIIEPSTFWGMPFHYQLKRAYDCVDGESVTIEMFTAQKYKTLTYPCYMLYRDSIPYMKFKLMVEHITDLN